MGGPDGDRGWDGRSLGAGVPGSHARRRGAVPAVRGTLGFPGFDVIEEGLVEATIPIEEFHYNPLGMVHGGVLATVLDTCAGCAVHSLLPEGVGYASIDFTVKFIRPVRIEDGPLRAGGEVLHRGRRLATATSSITTADGTLAATALSTCAILTA